MKLKLFLRLRQIGRSLALFCSRTPLPLLLLIALCTAPYALGRAGGGGGFGGGGGGEGGGGGGGGGDGGVILYIIFQLIRLCFAYPVVGIPVLIIVIIAVSVAAKKGAFKAQEIHQVRTIRSGNTVQQAHLAEQAAARLRGRDPAFDPAVFTGRVSQAFLAIQQAWCSHDLTPVEAFVSDGICERFALQFAEQRDNGWKDHMENIRVISCTIAQLQSDAAFDTLTARITAEAIDYKVNLTDGAYLSGSRSPETFTEYWSFLRKPGVKSLAGGGLIEGSCPNCSAPLKLNEHSQCKACDSVVKSGEYDWVLTEITQESVWTVKEQREIPGVEELHQTDSGFSVQHLEDRASVIFWRHMEALRLGSSDPVRKMATEAFCETLQPQFKADDKGNRTIPGDCAVGSVETEGILIAGEFDKAFVSIRWAAGRYLVGADGTRQKQAASSITNNFYLLIRRHGVQENARTAIASAHCPHCGAPSRSGAADACEYCGTVLNDGSHDWTLALVGDSGTPEMSAVLQAFRSARPQTAAAAADEPAPAPALKGGLELAAWMTSVMLADGVIDEREEKMLRSYASANAIPTDRIDGLIAAARNGSLEVPGPATPLEGQAWLKAMFMMALADGVIDKEEQAAITMLGRKLGMSTAAMNLFRNKARTELYQQNKAILKAR